MRHKRFSVCSARASPVQEFLLLVNYRPEYRHEWGNKTYYTQLRLDPLGKEEAEEMLTASVVGPTNVRTALACFVPTRLKRFSTKPKAILSSWKRSYRRWRTGCIGAIFVGCGIAHQFADLHLPTTVQAVLASRIDRLSPEEKALLQTLAVIGKEFSLGLVKQVADQSEDTSQHLSRLRDAEFIYEQPTFPDATVCLQACADARSRIQLATQERRKCYTSTWPQRSRHYFTIG